MFPKCYTGVCIHTTSYIPCDIFFSLHIRWQEELQKKANIYSQKNDDRKLQRIVEHIQDVKGMSICRILLNLKFKQYKGGKGRVSLKQMSFIHSTLFAMYMCHRYMYCITHSDGPHILHVMHFLLCKSFPLTSENSFF